MPAKKKAKPAKLAEMTEPANDVFSTIPDYTIKKSVSLPILKWAVGETIYVSFQETIETRDGIDEKTGDPKKIDVAKVNNLLRDNAPCDLVCGVALKKKLDIEYPEGGYADLCFKMTKHPVEGKRYNTFEIYEIII